MLKRLSKRKILNLTDAWLHDANLSLSLLKGVKPSKIFKLLKKVMMVHDIASYDKNELKELAKAISNKELFSNKAIKAIKVFFKFELKENITKLKKQIIIVINPVLSLFFAKKQILLL